MEEAVEVFNRNFMMYLIQGMSPKKAFDHSKDALDFNENTNRISCCCNHEHKPGCAWIKKFYDKENDEKLYDKENDENN